LKFFFTNLFVSCLDQSCFLLGYCWKSWIFCSRLCYIKIKVYVKIYSFDKIVLKRLSKFGNYKFKNWNFNKLKKSLNYLFVNYKSWLVKKKQVDLWVFKLISRQSFNLTSCQIFCSFNYFKSYATYLYNTTKGYGSSFKVPFTNYNISFSCQVLCLYNIMPTFKRLL